MQGQGTPTASGLAELRTRRSQLEATARSYLLSARSQGRETLSDSESRQFRDYQDQIGALDRRIEDYQHELARVGTLPAGLGGSTGALAYGRQWADMAADRLTRAMGRDGEQRAVVSGSIDIPALVETDVIPIARPLRLIDLFPNRAPVEGNAFEYYQQTARTNAATAVADNQVKPTSTLTVTPHTDRCRVIAHLSEPTPIRLWVDHDALRGWLQSEMVEGVLDGLEQQIVNGDGQAENMLGLLNTPGTTAVPFSADATTTLRSAVTALQVIGETPNGWALNPVDAQEIDLTRFGAEGGFLTEGYATGVAPGNDPSSNNIFGTDVKRVVSNSIPAGVAVLGDFSKLRIYVREDAQLAIDASGELFTRNQFVCRGEGRFGIAVLRPSAFAICDLTAVTATSRKK